MLYQMSNFDSTIKTAFSHSVVANMSKRCKINATETCLETECREKL